MKLGRKAVGIVVLGIGGVLLFASMYVADQVAQGRDQIQGAQTGVDVTTSILSVNPNTKQAGRIATQPVQKKIEAGTAEADHYEKVAGMLKVAGIIVAAIGVALILFY